MDNRQFDEMVKQLTQNRLSRLAALRGLAASALTGLAGVGLLSAETEAKQRHKGKGKAHKNKEGQGHAKAQGKGKAQATKVEICHCPRCHTLTIGEKAAQQHLHQHPEDRLGPCSGQTTTTTTTAPPTTTTTTTAPPTTTTTTTTTTTAPPCIPNQFACPSPTATCCTAEYVCVPVFRGSEVVGSECCGQEGQSCTNDNDCCSCDTCFCNSLGKCASFEIG